MGLTEWICEKCLYNKNCQYLARKLKEPITACTAFENNESRVPAVHGRWEDKPTGRYGQWQSWCSACGKHSGIGGIKSNRHKPFCPNCGAKMDGDTE